jgi:hypothetical protein
MGGNLTYHRQFICKHHQAVKSILQYFGRILLIILTGLLERLMELLPFKVHRVQTKDYKPNSLQFLQLITIILNLANIRELICILFRRFN